ncbi:MAG: sulfite oxidase-like oxidoreductase [Candidatus Eisenbacteria bacterium]|uniref:Sulfite oxidase-like oxidoreductase n=1 Tax=Eiseniibacteriota bacterium TaxID=2212470 RepID=A0A9D6L3Z2_UNCEI|nr:sulfite oxidase-like oxidoreductase [Candidatus Eisenbacteria bacterium]MBI3539367.1 sulfite oxidase-like oxidoreductase [Candidatus Eisenbacteria bacterium]
MKPAPQPADTVESPRQEPRLPPGQIRTDKWPVLHYGAVPSVDLATWDFRVTGLVEQPVRWTWEEFLALPRVTVHSDIHCVTRWSRFDNRWLGVSFSEVMRHVTVKPEARFAVIRAEQGFTTNLPLAELNQDDVLFALQHDGVDLTPEHGWPLRLVVPRRYFWKSAKWVRAIELVADDRPGFWEQNGYHNQADPWHEERFSDW